MVGKKKKGRGYTTGTERREEENEKRRYFESCEIYMIFKRNNKK